MGVSNTEARQYRNIYKDCVFLDKTKGEVHIGEVIEMVMDGINQVIDAGVLSREPCSKMKISLVDLKLHEDAIHRGPAQIYPAVRDSMRMSIESAGPVLLEPLQTLLLDAPLDYMGELTKLVSSKRGQVIDIEQTSGQVSVKAKMPVSEMLGMSSDIRSATEGRGGFSMIDQSFEKVPPNLQPEIVKKIRDRKGMAENEWF